MVSVVVVVIVATMHSVKPNLVLNFLALLLAHSTKFHRIPRHSQSHTFLQPTILTPIPINTINNTILLSSTLVIDYGRLASPEEALTSLAGDNAIVHAGRLVAAHLAGNNLDLS